MNRILRFKPHLRVEPAGDGMVFLVGELDRYLLKGRLHELVAPLVDGTRTEIQIIEALEGKASPPEVLYALTLLEQRGYLHEAGAGLSPEAAAFWSSLGVDPGRAAERLGATPVALIATGGEIESPSPPRSPPRASRCRPKPICASSWPATTSTAISRR